MAQELERIQIANRIREVREECGYTQEAFAAELEISCSGYKKIESGENGLSLDMILTLHKLGYPIDYIMFGDLENIQVAWEQLNRCSEADKFRIMVRLVRYFVDTKKKSFQIHNVDEEIDFKTFEKIFFEGDTND